MPAIISGCSEDTVLVSAFTRVIERPLAYSLVASDGVSERVFYFAIGGTRLIRSGPRRSPTVGEILLERGKISEAELEHATKAAAKSGRPPAVELVVQSFVEQADMDKAVRTAIEEEILDLFLWSGAEVHLYDGQPPKDFYEDRFEALQVTCDVAQFLQAVLARIDVWRAVLGRLPTGREVYEAAPEARSESLEPRQMRLLGLFDGTRTATDAMAKSGMRTVAAYELSLAWQRSSKIRRVSGGAAQKISRDELMREIDALEEGLKVNADATIVRGRLARALEAAGENARAAAQWRVLADKWRKENDLDRALECLRNCVRVAPADFASRELILEIHRHRRDYGQLVADGRPLADLFIRHNLLNRAKHLLLQLVGIEPDDVGLRRQLVLVLIGLGERELALKHLRDLARLLEKRKAPTSELRDVYMRILALDKNDRHARDRLDTITGAKFQRRVLLGTLSASAVALAGLGVWFFYEGAARRSVKTAMETARAQFAAKNFEAAKATLNESIHSYAHAHAAAVASSMLLQIEAYELRERERWLRKQAAAASAGGDDEAAARNLARRAKAFADAGRTDDAYRAYRELFDLHGGAAVLADVSLPLKVTVLPADSRVELSGEDVGQGTVVLMYSPRAKCTLVVKREGYAPYKRVLDGPQDAAIEVCLEKPTRWTYAGDASIDAAPLVANGMVYVAGRDRCLTAVSASDGAVQWRAPLGFYGDSGVRPLALGEGVFVVTAAGDGSCLSAGTGAVLWSKSFGAPVERQPVAPVPEAVVVAADDGSVRALSAANGAEKWSKPSGSAKSAPAALEDRRVAFVDDRGELVVASADTGAVSGGRSTSSAVRGTPAVDDGRMWMRTDRDESVAVVSTATCREVKRFPSPSRGELPPTVVGDTAYLASNDGSIYAMRASGDPVFRVRLDEPASASPAVAGGRVYVPGRSGRLHVLDAASGEIVWRFDAKSPITATPSIDHGTIYVPTASGKLYAVAE